MFFIIAADIARIVVNAKKEIDTFNALCESLPADEANQLKADRKKQHEINAQHRRNLEVARESRSRNFWGNY